MNSLFNKKTLYLIAVVIISLSLQFCKSTKQATTIKKVEPSEVLVSYEMSIKPILVQKCTPCHFPETGKKELLDTYAKVKTNAEAIIKRVHLPTTDRKFMPFKSKKPPLTEEELALFNKWFKQNMPK